MRILILGAGGIGGYYGARVVQAGGDVTFLVRPGRAAQIARDGLVVQSPVGDVTQPVKTLTTAVPGFDAILLTCKAYDLEAAMEAIAPAVTPGTLVCPLLNGMSHLDALAARFGTSAVLGGVAMIGVTLTPEGVVKHLNKAQGFITGALLPEQEAGAAALHAALLPGGFNPVLSPNIRQAMWDKWIFLATIAGMTSLMRGPIGKIVGTPDGAALIREMLGECVAVATASGYPPAETTLANAQRQLTDPNSPGTASMMRDLVGGGRTEHDHVLGDMMRRAAGFGIPTPVLRVAYTHLAVAAGMRAG
jgi:2-dehydropantoate 2-reductase